METQKKICRTCKKELDLKWFYTYVSRGNPCIKGSCKICSCKYSKERYEKVKLEKVQEYHFPDIGNMV